MSTVDLTPAGELRALRRHLAAAGLPTDDRTVVALVERIATRAPAREEQLDRLRGLFGPPR